MKRAIVLERRTAVLQHRGQLFLVFIRLIGIEPTHPAPEAGALSTELQAHIKSYSELYHILLKKAKLFLKETKKVFRKIH